MATRLQLHEELKNLLGTSYVYYQPPESMKLKYPCFVYNNNAGAQDYADNRTYRYEARYSITYITREPDNLPFIKKVINNFEMISHDRSFVSDNLYHEVFDLFY